MAGLGGLRGDLGCRQIGEADLGPVIACLRRGFPGRSRAYWEAGIARLSRREPVEGCPKYGYLLESAGQTVGVILMIFSRYGEGASAEIRCNLSSWCVDPEYRSYGARLVFAAVRHRGVTFTNVSPMEPTWAVASGFGFQRFCEGQFAFLPALNRPARGDRTLPYSPDLPEARALSEEERRILDEHAAMGCLSLICVSGGEVAPLVLQRKLLLKGLAPARQIVYCRDIADLPRIAGTLGRFLLARGGLLCVVDANGGIEGLSGRFFHNRGPKYFRGPRPPKLGDLSYSEIVLFGA